MMMNCILVLSHVIDEKTTALLSDLAAVSVCSHDVFLLNTAQRPRKQSIARNIHEIHLTESEIFLGSYGQKASSCKVVPGNTDLAVLAFWRLYPHYDRYWFIEYDVWCADRGAALLSVDAISNADLLGIYIWTWKDNPSWVHWQNLGLGPVKGAEITDDRKIENVGMGALHSVCRYSARLLDLMDWCYRRGWSGHHEATCATIANNHGLTVRSLNQIAKEAGLGALYTGRSFGITESHPDPTARVFHPVKTLQRVQELKDSLAGS